VWYWYCVDSRCTASPALTKLLQAWDVLRGGDPRSSVWALSTRVANGDEAQARADLRALARALPGADAGIRGEATAGGVTR
jgi:EpsI family protein